MGYDDPQGSTKTPAVHKNKLSETDIRAKFITPALVSAVWSEEEQIYREYTLRPGRVVVRGRAAGRDSKSVLRADYVLFYKDKADIPLAVIDAKDNGRAMGAGAWRRRSATPNC